MKRHSAMRGRGGGGRRWPSSNSITKPTSVSSAWTARYQASGRNSASASDTALGATKAVWSSRTDSAMTSRTVAELISRRVTVAAMGGMLAAGVRKPGTSRSEAGSSS